MYYVLCVYMYASARPCASACVAVSICVYHQQPAVAVAMPLLPCASLVTAVVEMQQVVVVVVAATAAGVVVVVVVAVPVAVALLLSPIPSQSVIVVGDSVTQPKRK